MNLRQLLTFGATAALAVSACAAPQSYRIDPLHSRVYWEVRHFGTSTQRGRFDAPPQGGITIDSDAGSGDVSLTIDTASVSSGVAALDSMLKGTSFLSTKSYPTAYFVANRFKFEGPRVAELRGEFTLRGVSRPLTLRATRFGCRTDDRPAREVCGGTFEAELLRSEYGSTFGLPFVGDTVRLIVGVEAVRE